MVGLPEGTRGEVSKIRAEVEILNYTCTRYQVPVYCIKINVIVVRGCCGLYDELWATARLLL